jgi:hypothetical protein
MPILRRLFMEKVALVESEASAGGEGAPRIESGGYAES